MPQPRAALLLAAFAVLLAACSPQAPAPAAPATAMPAPTPTPATVARRKPDSNAPAPVEPSVPAPVASRPIGATAAPSFDCGGELEESERLVCSDAELARLDRELSATYADALTAEDADTGTLATGQREWTQARNNCWKAEDKTACIEQAYRTRLMDLRMASATLAPPRIVAFACNDDRKPFTAEYYNDADPKAAAFTWGTERVVAFALPSGSGARYGRDGFEFWEHQGVATVDFHGTALTCRPRR